MATIGAATRNTTSRPTVAKAAIRSLRRRSELPSSPSRVAGHRLRFIPASRALGRPIDSYHDAGGFSVRWRTSVQPPLYCAGSAQPAQEGVLRVRGNYPDPGIHGLHPVGPGDDRGEVELGDLGNVVGEPGH